jgi:hypothetical protein
MERNTSLKNSTNFQHICPTRKNNLLFAVASIFKENLLSKEYLIVNAINLKCSLFNKLILSPSINSKETSILEHK